MWALAGVGAIVAIQVAALAGPSPVAGYGISTFATAPAGATNPDDISVGGGFVFVGFGNGGAADGSDGKSSTVAEYSTTGSLIRTFTLAGHTDGVRYNPDTGMLWTAQNEDGNAYLAVINPADGSKTLYTFSSAAHGGGYDDIAFRNGQAYFSASNPTLNSAGVNVGPALVAGTLVGNKVQATPVLLGNAAAASIPAGSNVTLNLTDPDSMTIDPAGDLVLDSQQDAVLAIVHQPGSSGQTVNELALKSPTGAALTVDDSVFLTSSAGTLLVADQKANVIYGVTVPASASGAAFSASPDNQLLSLLNPQTGELTPVITGLSEPKGLAFLSSATAVPLPKAFSLGLIDMALAVVALGCNCIRRRTASFAGR